MMFWTGLFGHCCWSFGGDCGEVDVGRAVFMVERTLVRFLTTWEAEVKFESSEPCPPPGGLWDQVGDADIRLVFLNRIDIFSDGFCLVVTTRLKPKSRCVHVSTRFDCLSWILAYYNPRVVTFSASFKTVAILQEIDHHLHHHRHQHPTWRNRDGASSTCIHSTIS